MSTELDVDIAALVGEMADVPCESPSHASVPDWHDDGPATHYALALHGCVGPAGTVLPVCGTYAALTRNIAAERCHCAHCGQKFSRADEIVTILGPVNK